MMELLAWVLPVVLGGAAMVLLVLWLRARIALQAAKDTIADVRDAFAARPHAITVFAANEIFKLLAKGEINIGDKVHNFGVVLCESGVAAPFLVTMRMGHLTGGDSFSARGTQLYKIEAGAPPPPPPPTPEPHVNARRGDATAPKINAPLPKVPSPAEVDDGDDDEANDRTVLFAPTRSSNAQMDPMAGLPYLQVIQGPDTGTKFHLPFTHATIGRDPSNIIPLGDQGASRLHCEIFYRAHEFILKDAKSTNGTLCNNIKIDQHVLEFGDRIEVADTLMRFSTDGHELLGSDAGAAIEAFEKCLAREPDFLLALKNLAFLLERDLRRKREAEPLWRKIVQLEQQK